MRTLGSALLLGAAMLCGSACRRGTPETPAVVHVLATAPGHPSTAAIPRVRLGNESRLVLGTERPIPLVTRKPLWMGNDDRERIELVVPAGMGGGADLLVTATISARDPATAPAAGEGLAALREGARLVIDSAPLVLPAARAAARSATLEFSVPERLRLRSGELTIVGHPLPPGPRRRFETGPVVVPPNARLEFGYGVDTPGWRAGAAAVAVRAIAAVDDDQRVLVERRIDPADDARDRRWHDVSIDVGSLAGRVVRFAFETEAVGIEGSAGRPLGVVSAPLLIRRPTTDAGRRPRNVVLISFDTLRARSVGCYGAPRPTSPTIDGRLAATGARVRTAVTAVPFTPPSHMTMLTGLEPCVHGVYDHRARLAPERPTLAEILRAAGWRTAAFTEDAYIVAEAGFARGFDTYVENRSEETSAPGFAVETFAAAADWVRAHGTEPFFLFVHTYQVHDPYTPPRGYAALLGETTGTDLDRYEAEIRYVDDVLADFLDVLDARGLADDTIVVATSDHGEAFGEHGVSGHGPDLHDEALLVPLVVRAPGLVPAGTVVDGPVGLVDLAPTILDLAGVAAPAMQGRSFAARLLAPRGAGPDDAAVLSVAVGGGEADPRRSVRTAGYKYIRDPSGAELLYDLGADPLEQHDLASGAASAALEPLRAKLSMAWNDCAAWRADHPASRPGAPALVDEPGWLENRDELDRVMAELRAAGEGDPEGFRRGMAALANMTPAERAALGQRTTRVVAEPASDDVPAPGEQVEDKLRSLGYVVK